MIQKNIQLIRSGIPEKVLLVAVSKTKPASAILEAYQSGQKVFGENKAQEMATKYAELPKDIEWHMIGHMQSNKVKYLAPFVSLIHSVDSVGLISEINKQALKNNRVISVLLQFHIAEEETKFGLSIAEAEELLQSKEYSEFKNIQICGVMGMATFSNNPEQIRKEFRQLKSIFTQIKNSFFSNQECFKEISMGMSGDYKIAIEEGSTMVRIGSSIFGGR
ncbi:MAG: YggS family pyridoxal phosphate-dependent enzyme [Bacteroidetes bacterium]|nr:YggS family pyridoxal phosphate-dependent enzyme [Bacteroidota bacterium]